MTKVITRREVNDLIEGTFVDDLDKAVLYGELSENPNFVITEVNSESGLRYTQEQALLDADIRKAGSLTVTLTPASVTVLSTATQMVFNISTGGTGTITGWAVVSATFDNVDRSSSTSFDSSHSKVTMTIPANTGFNSKQGRVKISVTTSDGTFESNFATCTQNAVGSLSFANPTSTQDSTAVTTTQAFTNHNCSNVGVASTSAGVTASISGGNVVINFPQNESSDPVTRTVTISGTTPDGTSAQSTHTITQNAASDITVSFEYTGENLPSSSGSISEEEFSIILENATLVGISAPEGIEIETGGTVSAPTLMVTSYPANPTESEVEYTIELTAEDVYGRSITRSVTITQSSDEYRFSLVPEILYVNADDTEGEFGVDYENVYDIVISAYDETITNAYYEETATVEFPENDEPQSRDMSITLSGVTAAGRPVTASGVVRQSAGGDEYTFELSPVSQYLDSLDTTAEFDLTTVNVSNIGYYDRDSLNITGISNLTENSVTATGITINQTDDVKSIYLVLSGQTSGGQTVYATGSTLQDSDRYSFSLTPATNTIPASATTAVFDIYKDNVNNVGYYAQHSQNVGGIANLTNYNVTATGISENTGSSDKSIILGLSGETHAGRIVYASGVTTQSASVTTYALVVSAASTSVEYNGTTQLTAILEKYVGGVLVDSTDVTDSTSWSDDSQYASVSSSGVFTANNSTYGSVTVEVTGEYDGNTDTINITVGASPYPAGSISVHSRTDWHLDGDAGSDIFTVDWSGLKVGSTITLSTTAITSTDPTSISVSSVNGSATVDFDYSSLSSGEAKLVLEATGVDRNNTTQHDSDYYLQHGVGGVGGSSLSVSAVTPSPVGPNVTSVTFRVTWSDIYGTISLTPSIGTASPSTITADGSNERDITVTVGENTGGSSRTITLTGETDFNDLSDEASIEQNAHETTHALIVTSDSYSIDSDGTAQLTAIYKTYVDGVETDSVDVTNSATWSDDSEYASISNSGLLTANNTTSSSITVRVTGAYNGETDYVDITIGAYVPVITHTLVVTATSDSIAWDGTTQLTATYNTYTDGALTDSADVTSSTTWTDNSEYAVISNSGLLTANNTTSSSITVRATGTYSSLSDYVDIAIGAYAPGYNPDIWWTETPDGRKETSVTEVWLDAYVAGTYTGEDVIYSIYINYNSEVSTVSFDDSSLDSIATAVINDKVITITAQANSGDTRTLGSLTITGIAPDGITSASATLVVKQIYGSSTMYFSTQWVYLNGEDTSTSDILRYFQIDPASIRVSYMDGNITNISPGQPASSQMTVDFTLRPNLAYDHVTSIATFTGTSVYGTVESATIEIIQYVRDVPGYISLTPYATEVPDYASGYTMVSITSSDIFGSNDIRIRGNNQVLYFTDSTGQNVITDVASNTTVNFRVYFRENTGQEPVTIEIEAEGQGLDMERCSGTANITHDCPPAILHYVSGLGQHGLKITTNTTCSLDSLIIDLYDNETIPPSFTNSYTWENIGEVTAAGTNVSQPDSYTEHTTKSTKGAFTAYTQNITLTFSSGSAIPGDLGSVKVLLPNGRGGMNSFNLFKSGSSGSSFISYDSGTMVEVYPGEELNWPDDDIEVDIIF